jgi:tRNA pseudouridine55 synthase
MNGVLVIDKPEGFTSHDVVGKVRRILRQKSVGHTGTLDPFATGVLVILLGKATRLAQFLDKAEKEYLATIKFGFETDTGDRTGIPKSEVKNPTSFSREEIEGALNQFRGEIWQTPPMYSAKKIKGKKLYELARKGEEVERQPVKITISELEISEEFVTDELKIRVVCSAGTYIRVLAEDIGRELKSAAHLAELRRTRAGNFHLTQAVTLEGLENIVQANKVEEVLVTPNSAVCNLPSIVLSKRELEKTLNGMKITIAEGNFSDLQAIRMCDENENLVAVGVFDQNQSIIKPKIVLGIGEENG